MDDEVDWGLEDDFDPFAEEDDIKQSAKAPNGAQGAADNTAATAGASEPKSPMHSLRSSLLIRFETAAVTDSARSEIPDSINVLQGTEVVRERFLLSNHSPISDQIQSWQRANDRCEHSTDSHGLALTPSMFFSLSPYSQLR